MTDRELEWALALAASALIVGLFAITGTRWPSWWPRWWRRNR